jgi:phenylalanyl-tRNA synthetase beta chain
VKVLLSWIRDFVDVPGTAEEIGARMSMRGLALEGVEQVNGDAVLDFDVTANRPDCLSMLGIAREIATAYGLPLKMPATAQPPASAGGSLDESWREYIQKAESRLRSTVDPHPTLSPLQRLVTRTCRFVPVRAQSASDRTRRDDWYHVCSPLRISRT